MTEKRLIEIFNLCKKKFPREYDMELYEEVKSLRKALETIINNGHDDDCYGGDCQVEIAKEALNDQEEK